MDALEPFRLTNKVAIVSGSTRGLGWEIARTFASVGARLVLNSRKQEECDGAARKLESEFGGRAIGVAGDVALQGVAQSLVDSALQSFGQLDIVVNNAGINVRGAIDQVTPDDYARVMATNVQGPWLLCRSAVPILKAQKQGRIVNLASTLGMVGMADRSLYCTSKGAIVQLTRELAIELAPFNVTVNAICPGPFETEMNRVLTQDPVKREQFANFTAMRRWGRLEEIGPVALFLASEAASYVTGAILPVDGGWTAW